MANKTTKHRIRLDGHLEIEPRDAAAFEAWVESLPVGSHGPAIAEWIFPVEVAKGIKAQIKILVPSWDEYRTGRNSSE